MSTPRLPTTPDVPVVRTDFSDQEAWERVKAGISWQTPDEFEANVTYVDDPAFAGLTAAELLESWPDRASHSLLLVVDETTIRSAEHPILVVDPDDDDDDDDEDEDDEDDEDEDEDDEDEDDGPDRPAFRSFRAVPHTIQEIENNLSIANMDWEDFADDIDDDGVRREHMLYGRLEEVTANMAVDQATE